MTSLSPLTARDTLGFNSVNFDRLTETYSTSFYGRYVSEWPEYQRAARHGPTGLLMGYVLGKAEGEGPLWHGHVSAVTVAPAFRRAGLGQRLMDFLEDVTQSVHRAFFVDLFVRKSNAVAQRMYERLGYVVYRTVTEYYREAKGPGEDALDLRKPMARDRELPRSTCIPLGRAIRPEELEWQ